MHNVNENIHGAFEIDISAETWFIMLFSKLVCGSKETIGDRYKKIRYKILISIDICLESSRECNE